MHLVLVLVPPTLALLPTKAVNASTPWRKKQPMLTSDPALLPKALGTHRLHRDAPTQGHAFKTKIGNFFT